MDYYSLETGTVQNLQTMHYLPSYVRATYLGGCIDARSKTPDQTNGTNVSFRVTLLQVGSNQHLFGIHYDNIHMR